MKATEIAQEQQEVVARATDYLGRLIADNQGRYERASDATSYLCAEVQRFLDDPEGVGYDALASARQTVLSMHAGNFSPMLGNPLPSHA